MKLTQEQIKILSEGKIEDNRFYLQGQLSPKEYKNINDVLNTVGLIWNRGKKAHIADLTEEELKEAIDDIIETGEVETLKETIKKFQFYPTPKEVAEYLVELAEIKQGEDVLEPSAGLGNIVDEINKTKCRDIFMYELDEIKADFLYEKYHNKENRVGERLYNIDCCDFINRDSCIRVEKIIMNPPFNKSQDVKHILEAYKYLEDGGKLVSIASSSIQTREGKLYDELKALNPEFLELPAGTFKDSGTMVNSVIVIINK